MLCAMGKMKAAVLPEPVCAHAIRSRLASAMGMAYFCTGVGFLRMRMHELEEAAWSPSNLILCTLSSRQH